MRKTWLSLAAVAALGIAAAGCSSNTSTTTSDTTAAPTTTAASTTTAAKSDDKTTTTAEASGSTDAAIGAAMTNRIGIQSNDDINACLGKKVMADPTLSSAVSNNQATTAEQTTQVFNILFDCGITPSTLAPIFTKGVAGNLTLTDTQTQCVSDKFSAMSQSDVITLVSQSDPAAATSLGAGIASACGLGAANVPTTTAAP
jgi:hypothetical protein